MDPKTERKIEKSILFTPLLVALLWMGFVVIGAQQPATAMKLSPSRLDTLVNALFAFIILYSIVLAFIFFRMNKALKNEAAAKPLVVAAMKKDIKKKLKKRK